MNADWLRVTRYGLRVDDASATRNAQRATRNHSIGLPAIYSVSVAAWLLTRLLVLVHQGAWPWMNAFVVAAARGMVVGDWNDAVRPQLPAVLGVPLVLVGATEQQTVAALYLVASLIQFAAFVVLVRALFPDRMQEQTLALLIFLLVPFNHSIHHYRDMPVILASSAIFLLSANFVRAFAGSSVRGFSAIATKDAPALAGGSPGNARTRERANVAWLVGALLLGVFSRAEFLTFVGLLIVLALVIYRRAAVRLMTTYIAAVVVVTAALVVVYAMEGVDLPETSFYAAHTFLDSTPDSWLTAECRDFPTENCRERDGMVYFGPGDPHAGLLPLIVNHPLTTVAKTLRSAWDNLWVTLGPNLSTFPGVVPFLVVALAFARPARDALRRVPASIWIVSLAVLGETVLPPLSWAPPHPQYHLQLVLPIVALTVPVLIGLARLPRGRLLAVAFLIGNAALSALRYTRYPGY
jgi:hypothetical protein